MEKQKVLVIDDDRDLLRLMHRKLSRAGFEVVCAEDGLSATKTALSERPDLVLLDVKLPCGDGFQVFERLRNLIPTATVPVIIVSGCGPDMAEQLLDGGADAFVCKPVDFTEVIDTIHQVLDQADS